MKLNLNFNGLTKLRDWWNVVHANFKIIEKECTKTREIADNACTKEEARSYINEFIGLSDEYMAVIEAFTELYEKNGNSVSAMDEVYGGRLKYYSKEETFDVNEAVGEDAIYFCKDETINTPDCGKGILISSADGCQRWINEKGLLCTRQFSDDIWSEWTSSNADILETLDEQSEKIEQIEVTRVKFQAGSYVGTGAYGKDNPNTLTFDFIPKVVFFSYRAQHGFENSHMILFGVTDKYGGLTNEVADFMNFSYNGSSMSWYCSGDAYDQLNASIYTYHYIAIG